jgi:hypothetical protein
MHPAMSVTLLSGSGMGLLLQSTKINAVTRNESLSFYLYLYLFLSFSLSLSLIYIYIYIYTHTYVYMYIVSDPPQLLG